MLSVILGYTELALIKTGAAGPLRNELQEIFKAAKQSADITRQLLAFARKQTISPKLLDLNLIVESMFNMFYRLIGEDIHIEWFPEPALWPVKIDPTQVEQILANLCVNARDAISGVGRVAIETRNVAVDEAYCADHAEASPGEFVLLRVSDDGCGMDKETLDRIFEPFFTTKDMDHGTGLGLATVYGIVKQNNGFIDVRSEPGKGSTFGIHLPRYAGQAAPALGDAVGAIQHGHDEIMLLVEDDPSIMHMTQAMLESMGYRAMCANTPEAAVRLAAEHRDQIRLLITDVVMPGMNGKELSDQISALMPGIKTLFMSGYTANVIAHRGVLEEKVVYLQKPFTMAELGAKVREALESA
jgi:CheY-like chemotaxis protein